ncbi:Rz1-like lysis system protein LysC [Escherichia coli]
MKYVPVKPVPIPAEWLADCLVPPAPEPFTFGASVTYNLQLLAVIENCNVDKASIRRLEARRQHEFTDMAGTPAVPAGKTK